MPTSVLLAVLAAAGLLALAPALVRRYDATERLVAERAQSTARVLQRRRRRRTVPGPPTGQPAALAGRHPACGSPRSRRVVGAAGLRRRPAAPPLRPAARRAARAARPAAGPPPRRRAHPGGVPAPPGARRAAAAQRRRAGRRGLVGPGFWIGFAVTGVLLVAYVVHLRNRALADSAAGAPRPGRRRGWPPGRPRYAASRPAGPRPAGRRSAGWRPSARRYAGPRWAWTGRPTCRRRPVGVAVGRPARSPTAARAGCAAARTRPAGPADAGLSACRLRWIGRRASGGADSRWGPPTC